MENTNTQGKTSQDDSVKDTVFISPKPAHAWPILSFVFLIISILTGMAAFLAERHWINEDRYANEISVEQAIAIKLPFVLKDLADQINRPHPFDTAWFASLKKSDKDLKQFLDQVQVINKTREAPKSVATAPVAPTKEAPKDASKDASKDLAKVAPKEILKEVDVTPSTTPDSFFGALDGLAHSLFSSLEEVFNPSPKEAITVVPDPKSIPVLQNASDVIALAAKVDGSITSLTNQEIELNNIKLLAQILVPFVAPAGLLDPAKTPEDSPLYKMAMSADAFIKASKAWHINLTDAAIIAELNKTLAETIDQRNLLDAAVLKPAPGAKPNPKAIELTTKLRASIWQTRAQPSLRALQDFNKQVITVRTVTADPKNIRLAAQKSGLQPSALNDAYGNLPSILLLISVLSSLLALLSAFLVSRFKKMLVYTDSAPKSSIAQRWTNNQVDRKAERLTSKRHQAFKDELHKELDGLSERFHMVNELGIKLRQSISMLSRQASEVGHPPELETDSSIEAIEVPEQIQEAFAALKQQGIRLYLAILDNHSGKQLAAETEKLNGLIEEVESTVTQTEGLVKELHDQLDQRMRKTHSAISSSGSLQIFEQDANRVMQSADEWKKELEQLGESVSELKKWIDHHG
jgi:hypothetical protein